jgi:hypothetical protein
VTGKLRSATVLISLVTFFAQAVLAFYRGHVQSEPPWLGLALAPVFLLPVGAVKARGSLFKIVLWTIGSLFLALGLFFSWSAAFDPGVMSLVQRVSIPLFLLSMGGLMFLTRDRVIARVALLATLALASAGLQLVATVEAFHEKKMREQGIMIHWH